jgi:hypothetical protein
VPVVGGIATGKSPFFCCGSLAAGSSSSVLLFLLLFVEAENVEEEEEEGEEEEVRCQSCRLIIDSRNRSGFLLLSVVIFLFLEFFCFGLFRSVGA